MTILCQAVFGKRFHFVAWLGDEVELKVSKEQIVITPAKKTRQGWEEAFKKMAEKGDDRLLDAEELQGQSSWDKEDWSW